MKISRLTELELTEICRKVFMSDRDSVVNAIVDAYTLGYKNGIITTSEELKKSLHINTGWY